MTMDLLAQRVINAGITPYKCEQLKLPDVKKLFDKAGFTYENMNDIFERWDIDTARSAIRKEKYAKKTD
jgi:hypothetical protein